MLDHHLYQIQPNSVVDTTVQQIYFPRKLRMPGNFRFNIPSIKCPIRSPNKFLGVTQRYALVISKLFNYNAPVHMLSFRYFIHPLFNKNKYYEP